MKELLIIAIIVIVLYSINRAFTTLTHKIEDHHRIRGAHMANRLRRDAEQRNAIRPIRARREAEDAIARVWQGSIERQQKRATSASRRVGKRLLQGKEPGRAAVQADKHERGLASMLADMRRELGHVARRYDTSPHGHGPRVNKVTGGTMPGIRRSGQEHPGATISNPKPKNNNK